MPNNHALIAAGLATCLLCPQVNAEPLASDNVSDLTRHAAGRAMELAIAIRDRADQVVAASSETGRSIKSGYYEIGLAHPNNLGWSMMRDDGTSCSGTYDGASLEVEDGLMASEPAPFSGTVDGLLASLSANPVCPLPVAPLLNSDLLHGAQAIRPDRLDISYDRSAGSGFYRISIRQGDLAWDFHLTAAQSGENVGLVGTYVRDPETFGYAVTIQKWDPEDAGDASGVAELSAPGNGNPIR